MGGQATWSPQSSGKIAILNIKSIEMIMNGLYNVRKSNFFGVKRYKTGRF